MTLVTEMEALELAAALDEVAEEQALDEVAEEQAASRKTRGTQFVGFKDKKKL